MPVYEYKCLGCGEISESLLRVERRDEAMLCTKCGAPKKRILSTFNVIAPPTSRQSEGRPQSGGHEASAAPGLPVGIRADGGDIGMFNNKFVGVHTGISVRKGTRLIGTGNTFVDVAKPVEFRDE